MNKEEKNLLTTSGILSIIGLVIWLAGFIWALNYGVNKEIDRTERMYYDTELERIVYLDAQV